MSPCWSGVPLAIQERLCAKPLHYTNGLLPVQAAVIPHISRTISSGLQMDYMLNAPTGSGKTLCFLVPLIEMLRKEHNALGSSSSSGAESVSVVTNPYHIAGTHHLRALILVPTTALGQQINDIAKVMLKGSPIKMINLCDDANNTADAAEKLIRKVELPAMTDSGSSSSTSDVFYYSNVDIIISTPQRIIKHITATEGFSLKDLKMIVMDEADQILTGAYTTMVHRIIAACEAAVASGNTSGVIYKILCSATMTAHITRVTDFRLRNCKYFSLTTQGEERTDLEGAEVALPAHVAPNQVVKGGPLSMLKAKFVMPPGLHEHVVVVQNRYRHAALLKVVYIICGMKEPTLEDLEAAKDGAATSKKGGHRAEPSKEEEPTDLADIGVIITSTKEKPPVILVFCDTAESARVVGQFVAAAGFRSLEFTAHATDATRRQALFAMQRGCEEDEVPLVVVTTDALMRGIDLPGIKHVVMYDPPTSLQQYVHRVGRTARALREGHAYVLLSRLGPSGTIDDGQVAHFKAMRANVESSNKVELEEKSKYFITEAFAAVCGEYLSAAQGASVRQHLMQRTSALLLNKKGGATVNAKATGSTTKSGVDGGNTAATTASKKSTATDGASASSAGNSGAFSRGRGGFSRGGSSGRGRGAGFNRGGAGKRPRQ